MRFFWKKKPPCEKKSLLKDFLLRLMLITPILTLGWWYSEHYQLKNAGVLPYTHHEGQLYFLVGMDKSRPGVWTDFGGRPKKFERLLQTARREFTEESGGWFGKKGPNETTPFINNRKKHYRMYLLKVDFFDPENLRKHIASNWETLVNLEKIDFAWVALPENESGPFVVKFGTQRTNAGQPATLYGPFAQTLKIDFSKLRALAPSTAP